MLHLTITQQYLVILHSYEPLLNGNGLAVSHAPGYASPDGTVTPVVKLSPAKEMKARLRKYFQSDCDVIYSNTYFHSPCAKRINWCSFNLKKVMGIVKSEIFNKKLNYFSLFLVLSCAHLIFRYIIIIHSFLFCFVLLLNLINFCYSL